MCTRQELEKLKGFLTQNRDQIETNFREVEQSLKAELRVLKDRGNSVIPEVDFKDLLEAKQFHEDIKNSVHKRGVIIVRNLLDQSTAKEILSDLKEYMRDNGEDPDDPQAIFFEIYWSKAQIRARQHANMVQIQKLLLSLWNRNPDMDGTVDLSKPSMYLDRFRMRKPGDDRFHLDPHIDSGSITRWLDPIYRQSYHHILNGDWKDQDPFTVNGRGQATMDRHCSFFRTFQGWTALTPSEPGTGTLRVLPVLKEAISYIMLRALMPDVPKHEFPGYSEPKIFYLDPKYHEVLFNEMISIPAMNPGDAVFWHPDLVHSVENVHNGAETNTVLYIPSGPDCLTNRLYLERTRFLFKNGLGPPDFQGSPQHELHFKNRGTPEDLNEDGKMMMGWI
ncbi:hypothetical protein TCAL_15298 [Tigriopus californicus]|uniref:DUF1479 domain-containing protein n=1 Tax=Tigriopus californicus TaxID=6832 RepID=A0A553PKC7_TIGCA|nr:uncharacterized protein YbiU-like [Tigriopus californicus]TRY78133.1 hypothetical protein TCAL_15298 [Tigriopus californicus]